MKTEGTEDRPPPLDGIEWEATKCPSCGNTWWHGRDRGSDIDVSMDAWVDLLGACPDCREVPDEPTISVHVLSSTPNRAQRRAARHGRRRP